MEPVNFRMHAFYPLMILLVAGDTFLKPWLEPEKYGQLGPLIFHGVAGLFMLAMALVFFKAELRISSAGIQHKALLRGLGYTLAWAEVQEVAWTRKFFNSLVHIRALPCSQIIQTALWVPCDQNMMFSTWARSPEPAVVTAIRHFHPALREGRLSPVACKPDPATDLGKRAEYFTWASAALVALAIILLVANRALTLRHPHFIALMACLFGAGFLLAFTIITLEKRGIGPVAVGLFFGICVAAAGNQGLHGYTRFAGEPHAVTYTLAVSAPSHQLWHAGDRRFPDIREQGRLDAFRFDMIGQRVTLTVRTGPLGLVDIDYTELWRLYRR